MDRKPGEKRGVVTVKQAVLKNRKRNYARRDLRRGSQRGACLGKNATCVWANTGTANHPRNRSQICAGTD